MATSWLEVGVHVPMWHIILIFVSAIALWAIFELILRK